jgi:IS30 family transposase
MLIRYAIRDDLSSYLNSSNKCNSKELTREVSCVNGYLKNLSREREVHMTYYTQLTQEERYHISVLCKEGFPRAEIACRVKRHPSTITRELRRHTAEKAIRLTHRIIRLIVTRLNDKWSPEQISGWLKRMQIHISHASP